jgi:DNA-directed RNA polymerase specialized sigma24 family protein
VDDFVLVIEEALQQLEKLNAKWARVVVMKFYGGMTIKEVATVMDISESSVERYWAGARTWLIHYITSHQ